jgi:hypothetical protein
MLVAVDVLPASMSCRCSEKQAWEGEANTDAVPTVPCYASADEVFSMIRRSTIVTPPATPRCCLSTPDTGCYSHLKASLLTQMDAPSWVPSNKQQQQWSIDFHMLGW